MEHVEELAATKFPARTNLVTAANVEAVVALGCAAHAEPGEYGRLTMRDWLARFTMDELLVLERAALEHEVSG
ncbi:MAG: hypothetical protein JST54_28970 [Deltaproteobacteria bacterium]|nr:hypothetical protein [Deltaproteobacteria bacterium]